jgi:hypothetical protein
LRAKATATGAVLFGVVGAAVSSATNHSMDREETEKLRPVLGDFSPVQPLRQAFLEALRSSGRIAVDLVESEAALQGTEHDAVVRLAIKDWGVRLPQRAISDDLAAFAEIETRMTRGRSADVVWDEHEVALGGRRHALSTYGHDAALLRRELTEMLERAGYRLANLLVYPRENAR